MRLVVCPHPPLLLPQYAGGVDPVTGLRTAVRDAVRSLAGLQVALVGGPDAFRSSPAIGVPEPLSLRVGRHLLAEAGLVPTRTLLAPADPDGDAFLVLADGSARRQEEGGPGTFDTRAETFDADIASALAEGEPRALATLDTGLGRELMVAGLDAFTFLGRLPKPARASLTYAEAPLGVGYFVAVWEW